MFCAHLLLSFLILVHEHPVYLAADIAFTAILPELDFVILLFEVQCQAAALQNPLTGDTLAAIVATVERTLHTDLVV